MFDTLMESIGDGIRTFVLHFAGFFLLFLVLYLLSKGYEAHGNLCFTISCKQHPAVFSDYVKVYGTELLGVSVLALIPPLISALIATAVGLVKIAGMLLAVVIVLALFVLICGGIYTAFANYGLVHGLLAILAGGVAIWVMQFLDVFSAGTKYITVRRHQGFDSSGLPAQVPDTSPNPYANPAPSRPDGGNPYANP